MMIPVIEAPDRGRAVFLGLLYETLIRMSTADGDDGTEVMVNTGPVEAKALGDLRLDLLSGRWPSAAIRTKVAGCGLELGFRKRSASFFRGRELRKVRLVNALMDDRDIGVLRGSGQLREAREGSLGGSIDRHGLSEGFRDSLESEAFILLADVSDQEQEGSWPSGEGDAFLATIVDSVSRTRFGKDRKVSFIIVMTGADRAELDDRKVFQETYPRTAKALLSAVQKGCSSHLVISWIGTVIDHNGDHVPTTTMRDGQVQLDYSEKEYRRLIGIIGDLF